MLRRRGCRPRKWRRILPTAYQRRTIRDSSCDRSTLAAVNVSLAKAFISKQDFDAARRILREALSINQEVGARGEAALDKVMLARVGFLERHPEQFDASVKSAIDELGVENRRADVVEARAMHAEALLAEGKLEDARDTVEKAAALRATDWLARLRLSASSAQLEAARGNDSAARQQLVAAIAEAHRAGCVVCQAEVSALLSKLDSKRSLRTGKEAQSPALTD